MLAVGGAALADVHSHIEHGTFHTAHEFGLCEGWALEMQASHHAITRHTFIVLYEPDRAYLLIEFSLGETLKEIASRVGEDAWLNDDYAINGCLYYLHNIVMRIG